MRVRERALPPAQEISLQVEVHLEALDGAQRAAQVLHSGLDAVEGGDGALVGLVAVDQLADRALAAGDLAGDLVQVVDRRLEMGGQLADVAHAGLQVVAVLGDDPGDLVEGALGVGRDARQLPGEDGAEVAEVAHRRGDVGAVLGHQRADLGAGQLEVLH